MSFPLYNSPTEYDTYLYNQIFNPVAPPAYERINFRHTSTEYTLGRHVDFLRLNRDLDEINEGLNVAENKLIDQRTDKKLWVRFHPVVLFTLFILGLVIAINIYSWVEIIKCKIQIKDS